MSLVVLEAVTKTCKDEVAYMTVGGIVIILVVVVPRFFPKHLYIS